ncbi:ferredoxin [Frankia sp. EI5c]|uniref:ferredoxin n=1 Tax=Frankia sp. EI5c TaxID=683316 RepID=UPI0007C316D8|nr:ferredoxin [Frankia sp. EI5c]OAA27385.1 ferredoxin [Frankia sp. EI5c]
MRIVVDRALCVGHARCHALEPDLFPIDDLGYVDVTDPELPAADQAARARRAAAACPERALRVVEHSQP